MIYIFLAVLFQSLSVVFGKYASLQLREFTFVAVFGNPFYLLSIFCLVFQALVWQFVLARIPLSRAYFYMSGVYILVFFASIFIFKEQVKVTNFAGILLIIAGLSILIRTREHA